MKLEAIEKIFTRLEDLTIDLPQDAAGLGADFLRESVSLCRGYLNEVGLSYQRVLSEKTLLTMRLDALEVDFSIKSDELLTSDPRVKVLSAFADRQAMVNTILLAERQKLEHLRLELKSCDQVEKVIRFRHKELEATMSAIRIQRSLLGDQLRTGSFYGDESPTARDDGVSNMDGDELDRFLDEVDKEVDSKVAESDVISNIDGDEDYYDNADDVAVDESSHATASPDIQAGGVAEPKQKKAKAKATKTKKPTLDEDEDGNVSFGDDPLQGEIDSLVAEGGLDETPTSEPLPEALKKSTELDAKGASKIIDGDIDDAMEEFLDQDFDNLDSYLDDV